MWHNMYIMYNTLKGIKKTTKIWDYKLESNEVQTIPREDYSLYYKPDYSLYYRLDCTELELN